MSTNAKYGITLSRYTVFLQNCPLGYDPNRKPLFFVLNSKFMTAFFGIQRQWYALFYPLNIAPMPLMSREIKSKITKNRIESDRNADSREPNETAAPTNEKNVSLDTR